MMKWRVILKFKYIELYFDFESLDLAGEFVTNAITHYSGNDDGDDTKLYATITIIDQEEE